MSVIFTMFNKEAKSVRKTLKTAGAKSNINKENLPLYSYLASKNNKDILVNSKDIVHGISKRPDTSYSISGILNKGLTHIFTLRRQEAINPLTAINHVFAIADKNPSGLKLVEKLADELDTINFKNAIADGILPTIEKANPENIETLEKIIPNIKPQKLSAEIIKGFLANNVNLY